MAKGRRTEIEELEVPGVQRSHFSVGLLGSLLGAAIGAVAWAVVVIVTNYQLGIIAWGLGALAGYGMARGHRDARAGAGIAAALVAVLGILAARVMFMSYLAQDELAPMRAHYAILSLPTEQLDRLAHLAHEDAGQQAEREHRCPFDDPYWEQFGEAAARYAALSDTELAEAYEKHQRWSRAERFEDEEYIRDALPYRLLGETLLQIWIKREPVPTAEWDTLYALGSERAAALRPDDRPRELRRLTHAGNVALLETARRGMEQKLAPGDTDAHVGIVKTAWEESLAMEDEPLAEAFLRAESWWDEGQWQDTGWLRLRLAHLYAEREWRQREGSLWDDEPLPGGAWDACIEAATAEVAQVPESKLAELVRQSHNDQSLALSRGRARIAQWALALAPIIAAVTAFELFDVFAVGLAVVTAYRVATAGTRADRNAPPQTAPEDPGAG